MRRSCYILALTVLAVLFVPYTTPIASAHGHTTVGDYELVIGFHNEPAYQGEPNGLDLFVTNTKTNEPVNDLADTLKVEIVFGSSKRELELRPQFGEDGAYTADLLPTEAGDYTWHIWGDIKGTPVDVSMTSSPDTFSAVEAKSIVAFPAADTLELRTAQAAAQSARTALTIGIVGAVLGLVGIVIGLMGLRARRSSAAHLAGQPRQAA